MTHQEKLVLKAYQRSGLSLLGFSFAKAMSDKGIRIALECVVKSSTKGNKAPVQQALI